MSVTIRAAGVHVTGRAILIDYDGEQIWLPKSQITSINGEGPNDITHFTGSNVHEFVISDWIAQQKGLVMPEEEEFTVLAKPGHDGGLIYEIQDSARQVMGWSKDSRHANMMAAALSLTKGKL